MKGWSLSILISSPGNKPSQLLHLYICFLPGFWPVFPSTKVHLSSNQNYSVIASDCLPSLTSGSRFTLSLFSFEVPSPRERLKPVFSASVSVKRDQMTHIPAVARYHLRYRMWRTNRTRRLLQHNTKPIFCLLCQIAAKATHFLGCFYVLPGVLSQRRKTSTQISLAISLSHHMLSRQTDRFVSVFFSIREDYPSVCILH